MATAPAPPRQLPFLQGGGNMGELIRSLNWSSTPLGPPEKWPASLKQTVSMMLTTTMPVLICWGEDYIQLYNDAFRPILGASKHPQALGISAEETYAEAWDTLGPMFAGVMEGKPVGFPNFMVPLDRNGYREDCYFNFSYSPIFDDEGKTRGVLTICVETTEKVRALERLRITQESIRNMVKQAPVGMCIVKGQPLFVEEVNDLFLEIIGKRREQFFTTPYWVVNAEIAEFYSPITDHVLETGTTYHAKEHEVLIIRNGKPEIVFVDFVYEPMRDTDGKVDGIMIVAIEVTDKVKVRRELESAYEKAHLSKEAAQLGTFDMDLVTNNLEWDERCRQLFGVSHNNKITYEKDFAGGLHPDDRKRILNIISDTFVKSLTNGEYDVEYRTVGADDGIIRWIRAKGKVYFDDQDHPVRFIGSVLDITDKKRIEARLIEIEHRVRNVIESSPSPIAVYIGREMRIEFANQAIIEVWGKGSDVIGNTYRGLLPEIDETINTQLNEVFESGTPFHARNQQIMLVVHGKPQVFYFNYSFTPLHGIDGKVYGVMNTAADVTDLNVALEQIEQNERNLHSMILQAPVAMCILLGPEYIIEVANEKMIELWGRTAAEVMNKPVFEALPDAREQGLEQLMDDVYLNGNTFTAYEMPVSLLRNGKPEVVYQNFVYQPYRDVDGAVLGIIAITNEVTEQVLARQVIEKNQEELLQTKQRLEEELEANKQLQRQKDGFIGIASHELKTPLTSLTAIIQVLAAKLKDTDDLFVSGALSKANAQVKKMNNLINGFLNISRLESGKIVIEKRQFHLGQLIREMVDEIQITSPGHNIYVHDCDHVEVFADRDKIGSVVSNLLSNAVKYSPKGKNIDVNCEVSDTVIRVSIRDEGMGVKEQDIDKLFDRYFRVESNHTKNISGFGIGLYLSAEIIKQHNGEIWAESKTGVGSTFYFTLPVQSQN